MSYKEFEKSIRDELKGYEIEIEFYPSGGRVTAYGCSEWECGTDDNLILSVSWRIGRGQSLETAVRKLKGKL